MQTACLHPFLTLAEQYRELYRLADLNHNLKPANQFLPLPGWFPHFAVEHAAAEPSSDAHAVGWLPGRVARLAGAGLSVDQSAIARARTARPPRQTAVVLEGELGQLRQRIDDEANQFRTG